MRNVSCVAISLAALTAANLIGCVADDTAGTANGGRAGAAGSTTGAGGSTTSTTTKATTSSTTATGTTVTGTGGAGGSGGSAGSSAGGNAGTVGVGGAGGNEGGLADAGLPDVEEPDSSDAPISEPCVPEMDGVLCARFNKNCGAFKAVDNCGLSHAASCGICATMGDTSACGGSGTLNVCTGGTPVNRAQGGFVDSTNPADIANEDMTKAFDNSTTSKWIAIGTQTPWIRYQFAGGATYAINSYTVTSANDAPARDPMDWRLEGSMDGVTWTVVDTRTGQIFPDRFLTHQYAFTNTTAYPVYRFFVVLNSGDASTQVAEIQLFGTPGPVSDAAIGGGRDGAADAAGQ